MKTPITKEQFANAQKGSKISDAFGGIWEFADNPPEKNHETGMVERHLIPPGQEDWEEYSYTNIYGENNIVDEELGVVQELNHSGAKLI